MISAAVKEMALFSFHFENDFSGLKNTIDSHDQILSQRSWCRDWSSQRKIEMCVDVKPNIAILRSGPPVLSRQM